MFLISELEPTAPKHPRSLEAERLPELDATSEIARLSAYFLVPKLIDAKQYSVEQSRGHSEALLAKNQFEGKGELLRAIGGATHGSRSVDPIPDGGYALPDGSYALLDGLAINLIRTVLMPSKSVNASSIRLVPKSTFGFRRSRTISFHNLTGALRDSSGWEPLGTDSFGLKQQEFSLAIAGAVEKLIFTASPVNPLDARGYFDHRENHLRISLITTGAGRPKTEIGRKIKAELNDILDDHWRRTQLAAAYADAPVAIGFPAELRAVVKRELSRVGAIFGTYSREGFSTGRFPYPVTRTVVQMKYLQLSESPHSLAFQRCKYCCSVRSLIAQTPNDDLQRVCAELTAQHIGPWHESICTKGRSGKIYYQD